MLWHSVVLYFGENCDSVAIKVTNFKSCFRVNRVWMGCFVRRLQRLTVANYLIYLLKSDASDASDAASEVDCLSMVRRWVCWVQDRFVPVSTPEPFLR